jgi:acetate kinase
VQALVMKTNEEAVIAGHTARLALLSRQAQPAI